MSFDWEGFLHFARWCYSTTRAQSSPQPGRVPYPALSGDGEEAAYRTVASRAYYAVFHLAADGAEKTFGFSLKGKSGKHQELYTYLQGQRRQPWGKIGGNLERLYWVRASADYDRQLQLDRRNCLPANLANQALCVARTLEQDIRLACPP